LGLCNLKPIYDCRKSANDDIDQLRDARPSTKPVTLRLLTQSRPLLSFCRSKFSTGNGGVMRIFVQPPEMGDSPDGLVLRACDVLREKRVFSARPGGIINGSGVVTDQSLGISGCACSFESSWNTGVIALGPSGHRWLSSRRARATWPVLPKSQVRPNRHSHGDLVLKERWLRELTGGPF
jgi:hypothetical protein